jgi:PhzF family phenazine biosynthesis protein
MRIVPFKQVDVFTTHAFGGNPVAVVLDAEGLDGSEMQQIANWTNLSETAFVLPPSTAAASYRVRIFTPMSELPFAGHPSVGTAHALLESGLLRRCSAMVQECAAGLLPITVQGEGAGQRICVRAPAARALPMPQGASGLLDAALGGLRLGALPPQLYDNGPRWWLVELADADEVRGHHPNLGAIAALTAATGAVGLAVHADALADDHQRVVRAYCPADGIAEDPVTGSANASIGEQLLAAGRCRVGDSYVASQGREVGRDGLVEVDLREDGVWIGGRSVTVIDGMVRFDAHAAGA